MAAVLTAGAVLFTGCTPDGRPSLSAAQPRGATVAFESIDGPPAEQFQALVASLNDEAQSRRLAVISRESPSAYRVRGYLAAKVAKGRTTITWVWDVFDASERRALRITGEEMTKSDASRLPRDAWTAVDDAMLRRIARASVEQLAAFLISPEVVPSGSPVAFLGARHAVSEALEARSSGADSVPQPGRRNGLDGAEAVALAVSH